MSFLLPFRRAGNPPSQEELDVEAQPETLDNIEKTANDENNDALALQTLDETSFIAPHPPSPLQQSTTLIPYPLAKLVTTTTGVGHVAVRTYAQVFGWGLRLSKETTLKSLELTRAGIEGVLRASAKDISGRRENDSELARADTENVLARSISALHWAFTGATFATSAGFNVTQAYVLGFEHIALQGLGTLNAILGSTESSRAVSAIITLIREEIGRPGFEDGLVPGYWDLIVACAGFVTLQRLGRRRTALEFRGNGGEETIWDLVIDDKGFRADVVGTKRDGGNEVTATKNLTTARADVDGLEGGDLTLQRGLDLDIPPTIMLTTQDQTNLSDEEIRNRILAQLPPGTKAVITSDTMTVKTVQVEIHGHETAHIEAPPGLTMISEHLDGDSVDPEQPHQTIIFRTTLKRSSSAEIEPIDRLRMTGITQTAHDSNEIEESGLMMSSPKRRKSFGRNAGNNTVDYLDVETPSSRLLSSHSGPVANQKKTRKPMQPVSFTSQDEPNRPPNDSKSQDRNKIEKAGMIKRALQTLTPGSTPGTSKQPKSTSSSRTESSFTNVAPLSRISETEHNTKRIYPVPDLANNSSKSSPAGSPTTRRDTFTSYFTMHEKTRESTMSQTDSFSIHSSESRPGSPTSIRTRARADSGLSKTKSQSEISIRPSSRNEMDEDGQARHHYRSRSFVPSLYSMGTKHSDEAIILQPKTAVHRSIFEDHKMLTALASDGKVPGMFPDRHLVKSIRRFSRFASASYGSNFLRVMGITNSDGMTTTSNEIIVEDIHHEHSSFATHTGLPADTILLSGFCDPKGVPITTSRHTPTMTPLMHFISIDHDSKAIVLTCRGTLGFEDILTDMTCDYDDFQWNGRTYQVHQGIHASARRMLDGAGRRVMSTIQASLNEYPDYGLILCGHSLGGAVAAVLALLISEPNTTRHAPNGASSMGKGDTGPSFVTATPQRLLTDASNRNRSVAPVVLPPGRPVHVFAYGPPAIFSTELRLATRGLITTIINHDDIVPCLSLGTLQDFKAVAIHLKQDPSSPLVRLRQSMIEKVKQAVLGNFWSRSTATPTTGTSTGLSTDSDEEWQWTALTTLRNLMVSDKLLPPGEVFVIETSRVFDRVDADEDSSAPGATSGDSAYRPLGRSATRVQFKLIRNVESRFREIRFGSAMFGDHSPGRYESGLGALERGIFEDL